MTIHKERGMAGVQQSTDGNGGRGYYLSASLVNKLIVTIFGAIITIAGYMILWAYNDIQYKTQQEDRIDHIARDVENLQTAVNRGILPRAEERIRHMETQLGRIESTLLRMEARLDE